MPSPSATPTPITPPRVPFIDQRTGLIDRAWYMFFFSLYRAALSNENVGPNAESLIASYAAELENLAQVVGTQYNAESMVASLEAAINALHDEINLQPSSETGELQQQIDALRQEVQTQRQPELGSMAPLEQNNVPWLTFNNAPSPVPTAVGTMAWDGGSTMGVQATSNVIIRLGESEYVYVKASSAITKGQLCYHTGAVGSSGVITAAPTPLALTDPNQIVGVAAETIALNGFGLIQISGDLRGFNTTGSSVGETWADGDPLYYNPAYVGSFTKTKPSAPNQKTYIGEVINAGSGGSGSIHIRIVPGSILGGTDSNVQFGTLADKNIIQYDSTLGYWKNVPPSSIVVGVATDLAGGAAGSVPYQTAPDTTTFLPIGTALQVLKVNAGATAPQWVSGAALTKVDDTNVTLTLGGTPSTSLLAATSLTLGWTGQLGLSRGGTNASLTASAGSVIYSTASALAVNTAGSSGDWLKSGGTGAPVWTAPAALTKTDDTNVTLTLGGSASTALLNAASITAGWTGQLAVSRGGTGVSTATANTVFAGPTTGAAAAPSFRALVAADIPALPYGTGTVTSVSVVSANGFAGSVATATTTPAITLSTSVSGLLYGNGTAIAATTVSAPLTYSAGTLAITQATASTNGYLSSTDWNTFNNKQPAGTYVTSVTGTSPVVSSGGTTPAISLASGYGDTQNPYASKTANTVLAGPTTGAAAAPTFRALVAADIPSLSYVTSVGATAPITSTGGLTPTIGVTAAALTKTDDTNVTLTLGGSPTTALLAATSLTLGWTGTLATGRGGTGLSSYTAGDMVYYASGTALTNLAIGAGNYVLTSNGAAPVWTANTGTGAVMRSSQPTVNTTLGVGGVGASSSGSGISFPATQDPSTDANTLDDYEENTWTPTVTSSSGTITSYTLVGANYTKIGRVVHINFAVTITNAGTGAGSLDVTLPFTNGAVIANGTGRENALTGYQLQSRVNASSATMNIQTYANGTAIATNAQIRVSMTYFT